MEFSDFCLFNFGSIFVGCYFFSFCRKIILKVFWNPEGVAKKQGKNCCFWLSCVCFFPFRLLMVICRLHISCCWQTCHSSLLSYFCCYVILRWFCFLVSIHLYLYCVLYFLFSALSLLYSLLVWQKPRSNHKISEILIFMFCFGACIPTRPLGPDNNPTRAREEPLQVFVFCLVCCS